MTTGTPMVSVVMSVFNGMPYLPQALESILHQNFRDLEFIVIDDGSSDGTWAYLADRASREPRLLLLRNPRNLGYTRSLNLGLERARGAYIARQDADDVSLPERLEMQVQYLEANPGVGLVGTLPEFIDEDGRPREFPSYAFRTGSEQIHDELLDSNCIRHGSIMLRRDLITLVGPYDPELEPSEDYDLWLRLSEVTRLVNLPVPLYRYREHSNSVSRQRRYTQMFNKARALEAAVSRRFPSSSPGPRIRRILVRDFLRAAFVAVSMRMQSEAVQSYQRAMRWAPRPDWAAPLIQDIAGRYLQLEQVPEAIRIVESAFADLFPQTRRLRRTKARLLSNLHMRAVFEAEERGARSLIGAHLWAGIRHDPVWLLNRGVWAIGVRQILHRSAP